MTITDLPPELVEKMVGPVPPEDFDSDGATCAPDYIGGVNCLPAALFHDFAYQQGGGKEDLELADYRLYQNLRSCGLSRWWAGVYFRRVRLLGGRFFRWHAGETDYSWLWLFISRYVRW